MKSFKSILSLIVIGCAVTAVSGSETEPQTTVKKHQEMASAIQQRITAFHSKQPPSAHDKKMRLIYFIGSDGMPQPHYRGRISGWFADYNRFFKDEFSRNGFGPLEMNLEYEANSILKLWRVRGKKKSTDCTPRSGNEIANEIKTALAGNFNLDAETAMIIAELSETPGSVTAKLWPPYHGFGYFESTRGLGIAVDHKFLDAAHLISGDFFTKWGTALPIRTIAQQQKKNIRAFRSWDPKIIFTAEICADRKNIHSFCGSRCFCHTAGVQPTCL